MLSAIRYMHSKNVLHRDLKTANIFLTKEEMLATPSSSELSSAYGDGTGQLGAHPRKAWKTITPTETHKDIQDEGFSP